MEDREFELNNGEFVYGVLDTYELADSDDLVTLGKVQGTIHIGDTVYISNKGDDDDEIIVTSVVAMERNGMPASEANNCFVSLRIREGGIENIKIGSVIRSENVSEEVIQTSYVRALGESYIGKRNFELSEDDLMRMSITDCAETMRLFVWKFSGNNEERPKEEVAEAKRKCDVVRKSMAKKILMADEIYIIINKITGEPHLFSRTTKKDGGYLSSPPEIKIFTKAYLKIAKANFPEDKFEIRRIENDKIEQTLFDAIYLNGALGVRVMFDFVAIAAESLVKPKDYSNEKQTMIPVMNPSFMRWMLLRAQIDNPQTEEEKIIARIYYRMFVIEMIKAKFIIPVKFMGEKPQFDDDGKITSQIDENRIACPIIEGKDGKRLTFLYSDYKRYRAPKGEGWQALVTSMEEILNLFDVVINAKEGEHKGCFVNRELFEEMKKMAEFGNGKNS